MLTAKPPNAGYTIKGFAAADLQACAERELMMRRRVYANRVLTGRMSQRQADSEIDKMAAIAEHLAELAEKERLL
jgi:hypothetical protein